MFKVFLWMQLHWRCMEFSFSEVLMINLWKHNPTFILMEFKCKYCKINIFIYTLVRIACFKWIISTTELILCSSKSWIKCITSNDITHTDYTHNTGKFEIWNTTHIHKCLTSLLHGYVTNICCGTLYAVYYM